MTRKHHTCIDIDSKLVEAIFSCTDFLIVLKEELGKKLCGMSNKTFRTCFLICL